MKTSVINSMQALYIIVQSWLAIRWDLHKKVKAIEIHLHIMYEDCREHINVKTKPKPSVFFNILSIYFPLILSIGV